jgi:hypothetical protein
VVLHSMHEQAHLAIVRLNINTDLAALHDTRAQLISSALKDTAHCEQTGQSVHCTSLHNMGRACVQNRNVLVAGNL